MNHRVGSFVFAAVVGLAVATLAFRWISDPAPRLERERQESAVHAARSALQDTVGAAALEIVDPLAARRSVGKTYVYRHAAGWQVSGYYRRDANDLWHPYLATLAADLAIVHLKISDTGLLGRDADNPWLEVLP